MATPAAPPLAATGAYLRALPAGLESYPECRVRGTYLGILQARHAALWQQPDVPQEVRRAMAEPLDEGTWTPLAVGIAASLVARDRAYTSDAAWLAASRSIADAMFAKPLVAFFTKMLSPAILLLGSAHHFARVHHGITLRGRAVDRQRYHLHMAHPPALFDRLTLRVYAMNFARAVSCTGAAGVESHLLPATADGSHFELTWQLRP